MAPIKFKGLLGKSIFFQSFTSSRPRAWLSAFNSITMNFKFIHAADLHIESPYKGIFRLNEELGEALVRLGYQAYENLIDTCIEKKVDFLLIAGDSFDSASGSLGAQFRFFNGLKRLKEKGIRVYIICGNHDPLNVWARHFRLPENVTVFGPDKVSREIFTRNGEDLAQIYGVSYGEREEWRSRAREFKCEDRALFSIAMLHGTLAGRKPKMPYCPFDLPALRASGMDYWALGHIHHREVVQEANPLIVYPGNLQGRHFNETGDKGCYLVEVDKGKALRPVFIPLSGLVFEYHPLDASGLEEASGLFAILNGIKEKLATGPAADGVMLRVELKGRTGLFEMLRDQDELQKLIEEFNASNDYRGNFVYLDKIVNHTQPVIDLEERKKSSDFIADLLRRFEVYEQDPQQLKRLGDEMTAVLKSARVGRYIETTGDEAILREILENAKWKCLNGLMPEK